MKKQTKNLILLLAVFIIAVLLILPHGVSAATVDTDAIIEKIAPDGENATFYMKKPTTMEEADFAINGYVSNLLSGSGYSVYGFYNEEEDICEISFYSSDYEPAQYVGWDSENSKPIYSEPKGWTKSYQIKVKFVEPTANSTISSYMSKLNEFKPDDPKTYYIIEDLSLINYYLTSDKSELWNPGAPGRALKYSTLNNVTSGSNVTYYLDIRAGNQDETLMFESAFGPMSIFYNGSLYGVKEEGVYLRRVIYIPEATANTTEAYVAAAQKRINEYLGNSTSAVVSYGGKLNTLDEQAQDPEYEVTGNDGNYYNIKIGNRTYKFYIVKAEADKLVDPIYVGSDISSKIEITSKDSAIPLDTSLTVKSVTDSSIKDKIGTENYKSYDISLYSDAKGAKIEKLENSKFSVKIPVPTELNGKDLVVYYITTAGEKEEHEVTIKDGYATFETNHFSVYTLAEKVATTVEETSNNTETNNSTAEEKAENKVAEEEKDETPKTGTENIIGYVLIATIISGAGIIALKRKIQ